MSLTIQSKNIFTKTVFLLATFVFFTASYAQDTTSKETRLQQKIESKNFVFVAQTALPLRGSMRQLTSGYDLKLSGDSLISFLPFFGRAFVAPIGAAENSLQFTSTDFEYKVKEKKKGWDVTLLPKDARDVRRLDLSISQSGYARLQVISTNRDMMSFNGYIE